MQNNNSIVKNDLINIIDSAMKINNKNNIDDTIYIETYHNITDNNDFDIVDFHDESISTALIEEDGKISNNDDLTAELIEKFIAFIDAFNIFFDVTTINLKNILFNFDSKCDEFITYLIQNFLSLHIKYNKIRYA